MYHLENRKGVRNRAFAVVLTVGFLCFAAGYVVFGKDTSRSRTVKASAFIVVDEAGSEVGRLGFDQDTKTLALRLKGPKKGELLLSLAPDGIGGMLIKDPKGRKRAGLILWGDSNDSDAWQANLSLFSARNPQSAGGIALGVEGDGASSLRVSNGSLGVSSGNRTVLLGLDRLTPKGDSSAIRVRNERGEILFHAP